MSRRGQSRRGAGGSATVVASILAASFLAGYITAASHHDCHDAAGDERCSICYHARTPSCPPEAVSLPPAMTVAHQSALPPSSTPGVRPLFAITVRGPPFKLLQAISN